MSKYLVTGASGFVGKYVVERLLKLGHQVVATSSGKKADQLQVASGSLTYHPLDLSAQAKVNYFDYFEKPDHVIHLAWENLPNYRNDFHITQNLPRHKKFLDNLIRNGLRDLTVLGTCLEYGLREGCLTENLDVNPVVPYAVAKQKLYEFLFTQTELNDVALKWVRLFYVFGKGQSRFSLLSQLEEAISKSEKSFDMSPGDQLRDFLPIEEASENIVSISSQKTVTGVLNCCSGTPVRVVDFVHDFLRTRNANIELNLGKFPYNDYEPFAFWGDTRLLKRALGVNRNAGH